jgi:hypothetical protein
MGSRLLTASLTVTRKWDYLRAAWGTIGLGRLRAHPLLMSYLNQQTDHCDTSLGQSPFPARCLAKARFCRFQGRVGPTVKNHLAYMMRLLGNIFVVDPLPSLSDCPSTLVDLSVLSGRRTPICKPYRLDWGFFVVTCVPNEIALRIIAGLGRQSGSQRGTPSAFLFDHSVAHFGDRGHSLEIRGADKKPRPIAGRGCVGSDTKLLCMHFCCRTGSTPEYAIPTLLRKQWASFDRP